VAIGIKGLVVAISNSSLPGTQNGFPPLFARAKMFVMYTADRVIATLRTHEADLRPAGLCSLSLFGSVARETEADSDIDLAAEFDPAARIDLLQPIALERRITVLLGSPVELLPEPVEKRRLQDQNSALDGVRHGFERWESCLLRRHNARSTSNHAENPG
jgi:predicted nucleotidyltransferase